MSPIPDIVITRAPSKQADVHTPLSYARTVADYAKVTHEQSLYPGQSFEALAHFLQSPRHARLSGAGAGAAATRLRPAASLSSSSSSHGLSAAAPRRGATPPAEQDFASLTPPFATHHPLVAGRRVDGKHLRRPEELEAIAQACSQERMGQMLLLRGYPSPSWLCAVGAAFDVDPEFFRRHLGYLGTSNGDGDQDGDQDGVSRLPSSSANLFQFRLPTIGSYTGPRHARGPQTLDGLRDMVQASMSRYRHKLRIGAGWRTGDSIVRRYSIYDLDQFCIEQAVTIQFSRLRHSSDHWIVIILMDSGADPGTCEWPEAGSTPRHLPFPHQKRNLALKPDLWKDDKDAAVPTLPTQWKKSSPLAQSASRLHIRYGRFLRPELMHQDPFYTLNELFSVFAAAEAQVLDTIERIFARDSWLASQDADLQDSVQSRQTTQAQDNLVHTRRTLEARISNLANVLGFINRQQRAADLHASWPHCADARQQRDCEIAAKSLQLDIEHLHHRAQTLYSRCESAMMLAMNRASIAEARRSLRQGQTLSNFTGLAFVFIPLTTTASVFGMNFQELGTGKLNVWLFFAVSAPLGFLCFMFLYDGWSKSWNAARGAYLTLAQKVVVYLEN